MIEFMKKTFLGYSEIILAENMRGVMRQDGKIVSILPAGKHLLRLKEGKQEVEIINITNRGLVSKTEEHIVDYHPELAEEIFEIVRTDNDEIAIIEKDKRFVALHKPNKRATFWKEEGPYDVTIINTTEQIAIEKSLIRKLKRVNFSELISEYHVPENFVGLLYIDDKRSDILKTGYYGFWNVASSVMVKLVDLARQSLDIHGQEILTKDRLTLRLNLAVEYQVKDPVLAIENTKDFLDVLYRMVQQVFRKAVGTMTLDEVLDKKVIIDEMVSQEIKAHMKTIGVEVFDITLKDVILPGEMRSILNKVVEAQKEAEANVIRRREETNATRSMLNTAKVISENPVMLRLKELEALTIISSNVENLTVHSGTDGLMHDLVKLRQT